MTVMKTPQRATARQWTGLAILLLPVLLVAIDNTVLDVALPDISSALEPSGVQLLWIVDIYPLVLAALLVAMGSVADRVGRRLLLLVGSVGFTVVSAVAAFAPTAEFLIGARAVQGFFGAMLMPSTMSLLRTMFADRGQRRLAVAIWASAFAAGSALGPVVGGFLLAQWWWGSVFLLAVPMLIPLLLLLPLTVAESRNPQPGAVDLVGILLSLAAMAPAVFGIKEIAVGNLIGIPALAVGVGCGVLFVRRQLRSPAPMLEMRLFARAEFSASVAVNLLSVIALVGGLFFISQHLQLVLGQTPLQAGLTLLPGLIAAVVSGLAVVPLAQRSRPGVILPAFLLIAAVGYAIIALLNAALTVPAFVIAFTALGIGVGAAETVSNDLILSCVPADKSGAASAVSETAYELGAVLGTATLGSIITASYRAAVVLPPGLSAEQQDAARGTIGGAAAVAAQLNPDAAQQLMVSARHAFDSGVALTAGTGAVLVVAAAVIAARALRVPRATRA